MRNLIKSFITHPSRNLTQKYILVLILLGTTLLTGYFIFLSFIQNMKHDGYLINMSGRQRMLSQRITLLKIAQEQKQLSQPTKEIIQKKLDLAITEMVKAHKILLLNTKGNPIFDEIYFGEEPQLDKEMNTFLLISKTPHLAQLSLERLDALLKKLDHAVSKFETENTRHTDNLIKTQEKVIIFGFMMLIFSGFFIFKPMIREVEKKSILLESEHKRVELLLAIAIISNQAKNVDEAIKQTLSLVCEYAGLPIGHAYFVDKNDEDNLIPSTLWHLKNDKKFIAFKEVTEMLSLKRGFGLPGRVLESGKPIWIEDVEVDGNFPRNKVLKHISVHAAFGFPIQVQNKTVAVLEFFSDHILEKNNAILTMVAHVGQQLGQIFEREHSHVELLKERDTADKANQTKSIFLANISHELRTPLHGIISFSRLGLQKIELISKEKLGTYFKEISESALSLMALLNNLLDLSKLEAGKITYSIKDEELTQAVRTVTLEMDAYAKEKDLEFKVSETQDIIGMFDNEKIIQVIRNLISNAIKFSFPKTKIFITLTQTPDKVRCEVKNQGISIPSSELNLIFDKFVQSSKTKTGAGGTGLGLAICKEIIEQQSGNIWAESDVIQQETKFNFELPRSKTQTLSNKKVA